MENNIASILFARGIMPDDFISYSTYAAVGEIVKELEQLRSEKTAEVNELKAQIELLKQQKII